MDDPSDRLRRDQDRLNRQREYDRIDRRHFIAGLESQARIDELTHGIEAARQSRIDRAFKEMWDQWPRTQAAIENCSVIAPEVQRKWLERLRAIRSSAKSSDADQLDELQREVNGVTKGLSRTSASLRKALYWPAEELEALHDQILRSLTPVWLFLFPDRKTPSTDARSSAIGSDAAVVDAVRHVRAELRRAWIDQLETILRFPGRDRRRPLDNTSVFPGLEGAFAEEMLKFQATRSAVQNAIVREIDAAAAAIRAVGSELESQATKCRSFWM